MSEEDPHDDLVRLDGVHVLVVDDNADARTIYRNMLAYAGAWVIDVPSAMAAVKRLRHFRPDVVVSDLSMPRRDGLWLVDWIRKRDRRLGGHLPAIAVTARDDLYHAGAAEKAGFDAYLRKPVSPRELFRRIAHLARNAVANRPSAANG